MHQAEKERKDTLDKVHELDYYLVNEYQKSEPAESYAKLLFQQLLESSKKDGTISPINFDSKAYHGSEIYRVKEHRFISKEEFESIDEKLAYKVQIIDEYEEFGGEYYIFENGLNVRKYTAMVDGKFVTHFEIVQKIPEKDRAGGAKELDSFFEGSPLGPLEYLVNPKNIVIKGGKKLFSKGLKELEERLAIKVEKTELVHAGAYNGYGETNLHIEKSVGPVKIEKKAAGDSKTTVNEQIQDGSEAGVATQVFGGSSKGIDNANDIKDITKLTVDDIPTAKSGDFNKFFNSLTSSELDELWRDKKIRKKIERQLRAPGGLHEWHLVSRAPQFKYWNISAEEIKDLRTAISDVKFVNPNGVHGGLGSTKAHNELLEIIDTSKDYNTFVRRLNNWANYRLEGGVSSLPEGLRFK